MKHKKILFIYTNYSGFVKTDHEILSSEFDVTRYHFKPVSGAFPILWQQLKQLLFLLFNIWQFDFIYLWFADIHTMIPVFFSKLTGKKSYLVVGGYDVCRIPLLGYGVFCSRMRGFAAVYSMKNCTLNLPVTNYVARKVKAITRNKNITTVYNCVNLRAPDPISDSDRTLVLTVGQINSERTYLLKGIDTFVETARLLPEIPFCIIGFDKDRLTHILKDFPPNVQIIGETDHDHLPGFYSRTRIYCQLSRSESFGIALAEAMMMGCIPLVTNEGGMSEVVGDNRFIVKRDINLIAQKIKSFLNIGLIAENKNFSVDFLGKFSTKKRKDILLKNLY